MALQFLRSNLKSLAWVLWLVIAVFVFLVFFEWGGLNDRQAGVQDVAATVGDEEISYSDFQQQYRSLEARYRQAFGERFDRDMARQFNLPQQALDQLINNRIMLMEAREIGLKTTDKELQEAILEFPVFQDENGNFVGTDRYEEILRGSRTTPSEFEESIREDLLLRKLNSVLSQTAYISSAELESSYREEAERAQVRFLQLPASQFATEVSASQQDLEAHFAEHQADYELAEQRVTDYLLADTVQLRRELEIPEEELLAYYDSNSEEFTREEQVRARHILLRVTPDRPAEQVEQELRALKQRIEGGEDFSELATELSDDEETAGRGGNLGFFGRNRMVKAFEDAAFNGQVGELVGPVKTDFGYHLIDIQARREGGLQPFDQVKAVVRSRLVAERVQEIAEAKIRDIAQRIETEQLSTPEQLAALATEEGIEVKTTEPFGLADNVAGIGRAPDFNTAAFELETGTISEPVKVPRGWVILQLKEIQDPRLPELSEVEDQVRSDAEEKLQKAAAVARLQEIRQAIESGESFDDKAAEQGLEIQDSGEFGRFGTITGLGSNRAVIDAALALEPGQIGGPVESSLGAVVFEVTDRKTFDAEEFENEKDTIRSNQETERLNQLIASLIELRRRDLTPRYGTQVLANFGIEPPDA